MPNILICQDIEEGRHIWESCWPQIHLFDIWEVRYCFQKAFSRPPYFLVAENQGEIQGCLALSWNEETGYYGHFPGETWQDKTWLEQNRIIAANSNVLRSLMGEMPENTHVRYLTRESLLLNDRSREIDETGYLFFPEQYNFSFQSYLNGFSGKSRKKLLQDIKQLEGFGSVYRHNCWSDVDAMFQMNLDAFGNASFFSDPRFLMSFDNLISYLYDNKMLRITTILLGGKIAAVDIGGLFNNTYTVLAGGTHPEFKGVAKMINFHHLQWACHKRLDMVDFLCGDFGWKERFHLTPNPLFQIKHERRFARIPSIKAPVFATV